MRTIAKALVTATAAGALALGGAAAAHADDDDDFPSTSLTVSASSAVVGNCNYTVAYACSTHIGPHAYWGPFKGNGFWGKYWSKKTDIKKTHWTKPRHHHYLPPFK
ncbi:hypothetical protein [Bailinhaonella thermotolerans]|uniref:Uncharacterized protein n=1 Tax=Bailinhaonella thermotolerans TaxID=1070861 RepID=A0A3A4B1S9_9ACTN|nr:hypothetical protein [Bailinhaonella thermotolerans]RJL31977.1 hypothetical protein D5H75_16170 [Bailinhaonella thermotolerans]